MEYTTLLKANIKRHKAFVLSVFILVLILSAVLSAVLTVWSNSGRYILSEIRRAGFGDITAWVSNAPDVSTLKDDISALQDVKNVEVQNLIYADYTVNGEKSDSRGQLITFIQNENRYRFFENDLSGYRKNTPQILPGEVYVPTSMVSMFDVRIGDKISFLIARGSKNAELTVKGFYEDPFMGSSMIGMKCFLICEDERNEILRTIETAGIDTLAADGAMLHIFKDYNSNITISELNGIINENTELSLYTEFVYSEAVIYGFMIILQNIFCGFFAAFSIVLLFTAVAVLGHSIGSTIESDFMNMGILKTVGFTSKKLRRIQLLQYLICIIGGMFLGLIISVTLSEFVSKATLTTTGVLITTRLPIGLCLISFTAIILLFVTFIVYKTGKIDSVTPIHAIEYKTGISEFKAKKAIPVYGKFCLLRLALRQVSSAKGRYAGACIVAVLLVFFASLAGRIDSWLGKDGKGLMDAFNPADHHIGVQGFGTFDIENAENIIQSYTDITDNYVLAMPDVAVNKIDYTANVISEPNRFHILQGKTCDNDNEIVITEFVAADLGVKIGDSITVGTKNNSNEYIISGIYQCANEMGGNIGMSREGYLKIGEDNPQMWCHHYFLSDYEQRQAVREELEAVFGGDVYVHENTWPGLFGIINAMNMLILCIYVVAFIIILIVTAMTADKIILAEQRDLGIYKAIGFSAAQLRATFSLRFGIIALIGSVIGTVLAGVITDPIVSEVMKLAGISNFASNPEIVVIFIPSAAVTVMFMLFAYCVSGKIKKLNLNALIRG